MNLLERPKRTAGETLSVQAVEAVSDADLTVLLEVAIITELDGNVRLLADEMFKRLLAAKARIAELESDLEQTESVQSATDLRNQESDLSVLTDELLVSFINRIWAELAKTNKALVELQLKYLAELFTRGTARLESSM